jgi:Sigma-70, region 4
LCVRLPLNFTPALRGSGGDVVGDLGELPQCPGISHKGGFFRALLRFGAARGHFRVPPAIHEKLNGPFRIRNGHSQGSLSLASALAGLDYEDREAVVLSAGVHLSRREAAKLCGCEVSVYDTRLCRGLTRLAQLVPGESLGNIADDLAASETYPLTNMSGGFLEMTAPN